MFAESEVEYDVVQAMDVNTTANKIYQHNFPDVSICASSIAVSKASVICLSDDSDCILVNGNGINFNEEAHLKCLPKSAVES